MSPHTPQGSFACNTDNWFDSGPIPPNSSVPLPYVVPHQPYDPMTYYDYGDSQSPLLKSSLHDQQPPERMYCYADLK